MKNQTLNVTRVMQLSAKQLKSPMKNVPFAQQEFYVSKNRIIIHLLLLFTLFWIKIYFYY